MMSAAGIISNIFYLYSILILIRIFLTWIPNLDWYQQPLRALREVTDVYLDVFKRFIPPMGGLDFSPIVALIVLNILSGLITELVARFM